MYERVYLAGGCFWGVEEFFQRTKGIVATTVGYANSSVAWPSYEQVCAGVGGGAETVEVIFDNQQIDLSEILKRFFSVVNPVSVNQQGNDRGVQYRSGIYVTSAAQLTMAKSVVAAMQVKFAKPIATEVKMLENYYPAEAYHQAYLRLNPNGYCHIPLP